MSSLPSLSYLAGFMPQSLPNTNGNGNNVAPPKPPKRSNTVHGPSTNAQKPAPQAKGQLAAAPTANTTATATNTSATTTTTSSAATSNNSNNSNASNATNGNAPSLCEVCHVNPKFIDGSKTHPYCGRTCAAAASNASSNNCDYCHVRPKRVENGHTHPYCGKSCAISAGAASRQATLTHLPTDNCHIPGCPNKVYKSGNGHASKYCSMVHKSTGENACIWCRKAPKQGDNHFCSTACAEEAKKKGPCIVEIPDDHVTFKSVEDQFKGSWRHSDKKCPQIRRIYKIITQQTSSDKYEAYRDAVEARGQFSKHAGFSIGNEKRRWHGTTRDCHIGDVGQTKFCRSAKCSLCCIMKTSYDLGLCYKKTGWGRFGCGIYTSSTSSKSDDYSSNTDSRASTKAIILNKIVVGKGYKMTEDDTKLTAPPAGFDSVLAEIGSRLNHDELVVYTNDAIRPSYLVTYDCF
ncbi:hypothetical protein QCA50_014319 [Cerrena zonata]|uniref:PARP catalytic domain-containing protein n=1 Tax=Cerrena zonata TaxID=2478898 RepID=A0AAW0FU24_9APHY